MMETIGDVDGKRMIQISGHVIIFEIRLELVVHLGNHALLFLVRQTEDANLVIT